jgi:hypothetical protein
MTKAFLIATVAAIVLGQLDDGIVTSTDLTPSSSMSGREGQPRREEPPRTAAPPPQESAPVVPPRETWETREATPSEKSAPSEEQSAAPRPLIPEDARAHRAVAAFWFILPET